MVAILPRQGLPQMSQRAAQGIVGLSCQFGCFSLTEQNNHSHRDGAGWLAESRWTQPFIITHLSTSYPDLPVPPLKVLAVEK